LRLRGKKWPLKYPLAVIYQQNRFNLKSMHTFENYFAGDPAMPVIG
jgi:hypothetical protein